MVEVTEAQYNFIYAVIKHQGDEAKAAEEGKVSRDQINEWKKDPVFWPTVKGHVQVQIQARGLSTDYIKSYLLSTIVGQEKPTREQMQAVNTSVRALGMGMQQRTAFNGKAAISPENITIEFSEGVFGGESNPTERPNP